MDEEAALPRLLACLEEQTYRRFSLIACVNQPDHWWQDPARAGACESNLRCLEMLKSRRGFPVDVIDHCSRGKGWKGKKHGVGQARKTVMDRASDLATPGDVIVSMDADTVFGKNYLLAVARALAGTAHFSALAVPYFHRTPEDPAAARAILRYEIYMRHYLLNLLRVGSPYAFTALGSAMAVPVNAYRAIGGMAPRLSGEDFYFLQKLRKFGEVLLWCDEPVFPEARFSDRVFFGTGPAMIRGAAGDWSSYPIYPADLFDRVGETYRLLPELYRGFVDTPVMRFLAEQGGEGDPLAPLRVNHTDYGHFTRAFHEKFDGLRILQFLKSGRAGYSGTDEDYLWEFLEGAKALKVTERAGLDRMNFSFTRSETGELERMRDLLYRMETEARLNSAPR